jgi:hypothetical protein
MHVLNEDAIFYRAMHPSGMPKIAPVIITDIHIKKFISLLSHSFSVNHFPFSGKEKGRQSATDELKRKKN